MVSDLEEALVYSDYACIKPFFLVLVFVYF